MTDPTTSASRASRADRYWVEKIESHPCAMPSAVLLAAVLVAVFLF